MASADAVVEKKQAMNPVSMKRWDTVPGQPHKIQEGKFCFW